MTGRMLAMAAAAVIAAMTLAGCAGGSAPTGSPSETASSSPDAGAEGPSSSAPPAPQPSTETVEFSIPACADQLDLSVVQANFSANAEFIGELLPEELGGVMAGPVAETALSEATQKHGCVWGVPQSDGGFTVVVAELPSASRDTLTAELAASSFTGSLIGTSPAYTWEREDAIGTITTVYAFASPVWVTVTGAGTAGSQTPIAADVLDHLRAFYPALGD